MSRALGLKAVAVVFTRLINSPATRSAFPGVVEEVFNKIWKNGRPAITSAAPLHEEALHAC